MARSRSRIARRRHSRLPGLDRPMAPAEFPVPLPSAGAHDPREIRVETGMRPYESSYDVSNGYAGDRAILLP